METSPYKFFLFDYADVISLPQDMTRFYEMSQLLQMDAKKFHECYWKFRRPYDLGQKGQDYWPLVAGRPLGPKMIQDLIELDCLTWGRVNPLTIHYMEKLKREKKHMGLLSNLPIELVQFLKTHYAFFQLFDHVFFSAEIHLVKPDREIYEYVLQKIKVEANEVIFFDDKEENLSAARELGMNTFLVTQQSINSF